MGYVEAEMKTFIVMCITIITILSVLPLNAHEDGYWSHEPVTSGVVEWDTTTHCGVIGMWLSNNLWYPIWLEHGQLHYGLPIGNGKKTFDKKDCILREIHENLRKH